MSSVITRSKFDVVVVGRGLLGSAAGRYLAKMGLRTALIGPDEPMDYSLDSALFSSHYDESRILRLSAMNRISTELTARSHARFDYLERQSGIKFYQKCDLVFTDNEREDRISFAKEKGAKICELSAEHLLKITGIRIEAETDRRIFLESTPAGIVNPRGLLKAECKLASAAGAVILNGSVTDIQPKANAFEIAGDYGTICTSQILLATGAYDTRLLDIDLELERRFRTVVLVDVGPDWLPMFIFENSQNREPKKIYWVPPLLYPDGKQYLKIGGTIATSRIGEVAAIADWFQQGGDEIEGVALLEYAKYLLPGKNFQSRHFKACVDIYTPSGFPYIGWITNGIALALGGNGEAAKSCDEIGRLAATLFMSGGWDGDSLDQEMFTPQIRAGL
ncbi:NAD(P)/FAD-dependent oxidoreductase [Leptospira santarosai]|uniref:NAD(P)/FAD-dependent oxidoreductase n=1 Tax=Leptospira santarosai TaxID=28183 RepID=UPI0024AF9D5B|nr:FAD-dependent oxidoreductase [Leptospira santarosai]MDO6399002.1 FAD-dependent oxidoreductase [Leptospira santarosai]